MFMFGVYIRSFLFPNLARFNNGYSMDLVSNDEI